MSESWHEARHLSGDHIFAKRHQELLEDYERLKHELSAARSAVESLRQTIQRQDTEINELILRLNARAARPCGPTL